MRARVRGWPCELRGDALGPPVEDLAGGDGLAERLAGIGDLEQADQEADHLLHLVPGLPGAVALVPGREHAGGRTRDADEEGQRHHRGRDHPRLVALHELPHPVGRARRAGQHRLVAQVALRSAASSAAVS